MIKCVEAHSRPEEFDSLPTPGRYRHFRGDLYELLSVAQHTETGEMLAVYRRQGDRGAVWVRPITMFTEIVQASGGERRRFEPAPRQARPTDWTRRPGRVARELLAVLREHGTAVRRGCRRMIEWRPARDAHPQGDDFLQRSRASVYARAASPPTVPEHLK
jgi:hypothetical protein